MRAKRAKFSGNVNSTITFSVQKSHLNQSLGTSGQIPCGRVCPRQSIRIPSMARSRCAFQRPRLPPRLGFLPGASSLCSARFPKRALAFCFSVVRSTVHGIHPKQRARLRRRALQIRLAHNIRSSHKKSAASLRRFSLKTEYHAKKEHCVDAAPPCDRHSR